MEKVFVRAAYNYDVDAASEEAGLDCSSDRGRTQQSFAEECDINVIVRRIGIGNDVPQNLHMVMQGDFTEVTDYQSAMNLLVAARESFDAQPAAVRSRFDNDPAKFVDFTSKRENFEEAVKFGLVRPEVAAAVAEKAAAKRKAEVDAEVRLELERRAKAAGGGGTVST